MKHWFYCFLIVFVFVVSCTTIPASTEREPAATTAEELEQARILAYWRDYVDSPRGSVDEIKSIYLELRKARVDCERFLKMKEGDSFTTKGKTRLAEVFLRDPTTSLWSNVNGVNCSYDNNTKDCFIRSSSGNLYIDMSDQMGRAKFYVCAKPGRVPASLVPAQENQ